MKFLIVELETSRPYAWVDQYAWQVATQAKVVHLAVGMDDRFVRFFFALDDWAPESAAAWLQDTFSHLYAPVLLGTSREFNEPLDLVTWHVSTPYGVVKEAWHIGWAPQSVRN